MGKGLARCCVGDTPSEPRDDDDPQLRKVARNLLRAVDAVYARPFGSNYSDVRVAMIPTLVAQVGRAGWVAGLTE